MAGWRRPLDASGGNPYRSAEIQYDPYHCRDSQGIRIVEGSRVELRFPWRTSLSHIGIGTVTAATTLRTYPWIGVPPKGYGEQPGSWIEGVWFYISMLFRFGARSHPDRRGDAGECPGPSRPMPPPWLGSIGPRWPCPYTAWIRRPSCVSVREAQGDSGLGKDVGLPTSARWLQRRWLPAGPPPSGSPGFGARRRRSSETRCRIQDPI